MKKTILHPDTGKPVHFVNKLAATYDEFVLYHPIGVDGWAMKSTFASAIAEGGYFHPGMTREFYDLNLLVLSFNLPAQQMNELAVKLVDYTTQYTKDTLKSIM